MIFQTRAWRGSASAPAIAPAHRPAARRGWIRCFGAWDGDEDEDEDGPFHFFQRNLASLLRWRIVRSYACVTPFFFFLLVNNHSVEQWEEGWEKKEDSRWTQTLLYYLYLCVYLFTRFSIKMAVLGTAREHRWLPLMLLFDLTWCLECQSNAMMKGCLFLLLLKGVSASPTWYYTWRNPSQTYNEI